MIKLHVLGANGVPKAPIEEGMMAHQFVKSVPVTGFDGQYQLLLECGCCHQEFKSRTCTASQINAMAERYGTCTCKHPGCNACQQVNFSGK